MDRTLVEGAPGEGLSAAGLARLDAALGELIARGELAGASILAARGGRVVHRSLQGVKDIATGEPLAEDTIFRIFSMTKPVTAVAMMMLWDEGLWSPDDPVARRLPAFADVRLVGGAAPAQTPLMRHLMTHTMGLSYGWDPADPVDQAYMAQDVWNAPNLDDFARRVARAPLAFEPGSHWRYSLSMDVQGAVIEALTGQRLADFMQARLFGPLGMVDTGFHVPAEKLPRLASLYRMSASRGGLKLVEKGLRDPATPPDLPNAGGGLFGTKDDYARFAQMLANRGVYDGRRYLSEAAVALMTRNHLSEAVLQARPFVGLQKIRPGYGQGFNGAVFHDPAAAGSRVGRGTYQWDGAGGTWFWVDPENDLIFVGMIQRMAEEGSPHLQAITQDLMADVLAG